jgi:hypothetical protein
VGASAIEASNGHTTVSMTNEYRLARHQEIMGRLQESILVARLQIGAVVFQADRLSANG